MSPSRLTLLRFRELIANGLLLSPPAKVSEPVAEVPFPTKLSVLTTNLALSPSLTFRNTNTFPRLNFPNMDLPTSASEVLFWPALALAVLYKLLLKESPSRELPLPLSLDLLSNSTAREIVSMLTGDLTLDSETLTLLELLTSYNTALETVSNTDQVKTSAKRFESARNAS